MKDRFIFWDAFEVFRERLGVFEIVLGAFGGAT